MNIADILYNLIIYPFEFIIEIIYLIFRRNDLGTRIIIIGILVNILALPLYNLADKWQKKESDLQKYFKPKLDDIKAVFTGDKRQMIIQTFYRINNYHPIYALRSLLGLMIQVPIFIAAYHFISNLDSISGRSFGIIKNLAEPDGLIKIFRLKINFLPILMTAVNILASMLHTRGKTKKERGQLFAMAGFFLAILYNSPSALVVYWTTTNMFSLFKNILILIREETNNFEFAKIIEIINKWVESLSIRFKKFNSIFMRVKNIFNEAIFVSIKTFVKKLYNKKIVKIAKVDKAKVIKYIQIGLSIIIALYFVIIRLGIFYTKPDTIIIVNSLFILSIILLVVQVLPFEKIVVLNKKESATMFISASFLIAILLGAFIPISLIASSPDEFSNTNYLIGITFLRLFSLIFIYPVLFYFAFGEKTKNKMILLFSFVSLYFLFNTFLFTGEYGTLNKDLMFDSPDKLLVSFKDNILNISVGFIIFAILSIALYFRKSFIIKNIIIISSLSLIVISVKDLYDIDKAQKFKAKVSEENYQVKVATKEKPRIIDISKDGENVFVFFMDRAIPYYLPITLDNMPELVDELDGFVWYPKTISLATGTLGSIFSLFGGYDYTPLKVMKRDKESLREKYNEATLLIPQIFTSNGYIATLVYPPIAGWYWGSDVSIFKPYTNIKAYRKAFNIEEYITDYTTVSNNYTDVYLMNFSLFRSLPMYFRYSVYNNGNWGAPKDRTSLNEGFKEYQYLKELTNIINIVSNKNTYTLFGNDMTHEPQHFNRDYKPSLKYINATRREREKYGDVNLAKQAYANGAMLVELRNFVNFLKSNDMYDNTKIIVVSDHGGYIPVNSIFGLKGTNTFSRRLTELNTFNSLLLVKDFNSRGKISTNTNFMTTADMPIIATSHLNTALKNYNEYESKENNLYPVIIKSRISEQYKNTFNVETMFNIKGNPFNTNNWREITNYKEIIK